MTRTEFRRLAGEIKPSQFLDYREWLASLYRHIKEGMEKYSYKQLAQDLGFPANNVIHHVIRGRRPLTQSAAERIITALQLKANERAFLRLLVDYSNSPDAKGRKQALGELFALKDRMVANVDDKLSLEFFRHWYHPVIAEMTRLEGFQSDSQWIAKNLHGMVKPEEVTKSLNLLENMGLIEFDDDSGRHVRTNKDPSTGPQVVGLAVANFHTQMISHASESIVRFKKDQRDVSSLTLAVDEESMAELKQIIHRFQNEILRVESQTREPSQIVQLNFQLFPMSRVVETEWEQEDDEVLPKGA